MMVAVGALSASPPADTALREETIRNRREITTRALIEPSMLASPGSAR